MSERIKAAVIGAGDIGAQLDVAATATPLSHAGGYRAAGYELAALVDSNPAARAAAVRWGCRFYGDLEAMMRAEAPAVVSLAVPTEMRAELLRRVLPFRPRLIIAEKPLARTAAEAAALAASCDAAGIALIVNYSRRFVPAWRQLQGASAMTATIRYAKGVRHNGTHAIDLCRMLFGECSVAQALSRKHDHWSDDPSVSAFLRFARCPEVFLQALDERCFTLFEVDIVDESWRIVVDHDGRRLRRFAQRDGVGIPPGKRLVEIGEESTGAELAMVNLMRHAADVMTGAVPWCSGADAVAAQRIAEQLLA